MSYNYLDLPWGNIVYDVDSVDGVISIYRRGGRLPHPSLEPSRLALAVFTEMDAQGESLEILIESPEYDGTCRSAARGYHSLPNYILQQVVASQSPQTVARTVSQALSMLNKEEVREKAKTILGQDIPEDFEVVAIVEFLSEIRSIRHLLADDPTGFTLVNDLHRVALAVSRLDSFPDANSFGLQKAVDRYGVLYNASAERLKY